MRPRPTPGPFLRDFEAYWAAGSAWNAHTDPYGGAIWNEERNVAGVDARRDEVLPFVGPPATLLAWALFARLPYAIAAVLWSAFLAISLLLLVATAVRGSGEEPASFPFLAILALAVTFGPVTSDLALGQLALPAFAGATLVVLVAARGLPLATAAACFAFAQANASLGLASQFGRNRATLAVALAGILTYALGALAASWAWPLEYLRILAAHGAAEQFVAIQIQPGFDRLRLRRDAACCAHCRGRSDSARHRGRSPDRISSPGSVCSLCRFLGPRALCSRLFPRARPRRGVRRSRLVRVTSSRGGAHYRALRNAAGLRRLARALAAPDGYYAERVAGARGAVCLYGGRQPDRTSRTAGCRVCVRPDLCRRSLACYSPPYARLARRAWSLPRAGPRADCGGVGGRATGKRIGCGDSRVGTAALAIAPRVRAPRLRYISTFIMLSNGVTAFGWKFFKSPLYA